MEYYHLIDEQDHYYSCHHYHHRHHHHDHEQWTDVWCVIKHGPLPVLRLSHAFLLPLKCTKVQPSGQSNLHLSKIHHCRQFWLVLVTLIVMMMLLLKCKNVQLSQRTHVRVQFWCWIEGQAGGWFGLQLHPQRHFILKQHSSSYYWVSLASFISKYLYLLLFLYLFCICICICNSTVPLIAGCRQFSWSLNGHLSLSLHQVVRHQDPHVSKIQFWWWRYWWW